MVKKLPDNAIWKHFKGEGEKAHFYGANGFPLNIYNRLLTRLAEKYKISALESRPAWPDISLPPKSRDWILYADDLISFIENECNAPVIGIGHSIGATCTILAAEKRPDLFKSLVLIEPANLPKGLATLAGLLPKSIMNRTQPAKGTLKKKDIWTSRESFIKDFKQIRGFRNFEEESFQMMAEYGVKETRNGQFQLTFPKVWEAHNYTKPPYVMGKLENLKMPCVAIRAKPSVFFTEALWQEWQKRCPNTIFKEDLSLGHLMPLENSSACFDLIDSGITKMG